MHTLQHTVMVASGRERLESCNGNSNRWVDSARHESNKSKNCIGTIADCIVFTDAMMILRSSEYRIWVLPQASLSPLPTTTMNDVEDTLLLVPFPTSPTSS